MLLLAISISVLTSISLSAIATNRKVRGGGDYYIISRSLGVEYGGALGLLLFVAQAVSVAFYCIGFGEAVTSIAGGDPSMVKGVAAVAGRGALRARGGGRRSGHAFQYLIMVVLAAALVSFFAGAVRVWDPELLRAGWTGTAGSDGFWVIFAILFPAVTGFSQGVSMSGDLKDPSRSLPLGTFLAVGLSTLVYTGAMVALAGSASVTGLAADYDAIARVAWTPIAIDAGVLAATLSSALASFIGAPRILQALARDRLFAVLTPLGQGYGDRDNPRRAVALTAVIALGTIAAGDLNAIASLVSMFFLVSYGLLNYATYVEAVAASPSFRPRFRFFHARASLAGTALCGLVMLMIDPMASAIALGMLSAVYHYLRRTAIPVRWHDNQHAYRFRRVKDGLRELTEHAEGSSDWQPHILAFTETVERRERVLRVASWIAGGSGLITAVQLVEGDGASAAVRQQCLEAERALRSELDATSLDAFPLVVAAPDLRTATLTLLQSWGVGSHPREHRAPELA